MFILFVALPLIVQTIIQLVIVFGIPLLIPLFSLILAIKKDGKLLSVIIFILSLICAVLYFINLIPLLSL
jgi:hypothetical protein